MENYYILSFLLGIFMKLYDDFIDLKITVNKYILTILQILIVFITFFIVRKEHILGIIAIFSFVVVWWFKHVDDIFWYVYAISIVMTCLVFYKKFKLREYFSYNIFLVLFIPFMTYTDETMFPEEICEDKIISRTYGVIIFSTMLFVITYMDLKIYWFAYLLYCFIGYFFTSAAVQTIYANCYNLI